MSIHWTLIALFLFGQMAAVGMLLLPFFSPVWWRQLFKSKFSKLIITQVEKYYLVLAIILGLFFIDSIREIVKYGNVEHSHEHLDEEFKHKMELFKAQRNFYITGFSLFLCYVIRRLKTLISSQAKLLEIVEGSTEKSNFKKQEETSESAATKKEN